MYQTINNFHMKNIENIEKKVPVKEPKKEQLQRSGRKKQTSFIFVRIHDVTWLSRALKINAFRIFMTLCI